MAYAPKAQRKLISNRKAIAAEAARLEAERAASDEPLPAGVDPIQVADLIVSYRAMGDFHHPTTRAILDDCLDVVPDGTQDAGGDFLRAVAERGARYGIATTARALLAVRAGAAPRHPASDLEAYAAHCRPSAAPKSEAARALLEDWIASAL